MIVNHLLEGWEVISHYTHGLLAGKIAMQVKPSFRPAYWEDVLTAIIEHDDYLLDFDKKNYLTDIGTPMDFTQDKRSDSDALAHAELVIENAAQKSQMVALLIGAHLEFLYGDKIAAHKGFKSFFNMVLTERKKQLKLYGWSKDNLEEAYGLMRFCDRASLILCQRQLPARDRKLEINKGLEHHRYFIHGEPGKVSIEPWPFQESRFELHYETRLLQKASFRSNKQLAKAVEKAPIKLESVVFEGVDKQG
ncbi:DUF3891 family protein [Zeaxanthinibacter enoshimensis]|uniref:Uncharacterized protein DUF3891 n=1 Tax=Zeaxanthinibacter enoshimensis TaxID=392009 RepID=A0A4R6TGK0_9FLAO|nr:DUF3891 family protein [Zeaxanthinibacter enoshimensis]TDQ29367.1 uncharacterized protein DUF3891 [Zeaxanthinibacter enoshimensis]